jgi:hypothetical protein
MVMTNMQCLWLTCIAHWQQSYLLWHQSIPHSHQSDLHCHQFDLHSHQSDEKGIESAYDRVESKRARWRRRPCTGAGMWSRRSHPKSRWRRRRGRSRSSGRMVGRRSRDRKAGLGPSWRLPTSTGSAELGPYDTFLFVDIHTCIDGVLCSRFVVSVARCNVHHFIHGELNGPAKNKWKPLTNNG